MENLSEKDLEQIEKAKKELKLSITKSMMSSGIPASHFFSVLMVTCASFVAAFTVVDIKTKEQESYMAEVVKNFSDALHEFAKELGDRYNSTFDKNVKR